MKASTAPGPRRVLLALIGVAFVASSVLAHPGSGIAVDDAGNVHFTDTGRGVWRIDRERKLTLVSDIAWHWMAFDPAGRFARAPEEFGEWFGRVTPEGQKPTLVRCSDFPITIAPDGDLFFANMHSLTIVRRTPAGRQTPFTTPATFGFPADKVVGVNGIAAGPDGTIYIVMLDDLHQSEASTDHRLYAIANDGTARLMVREFIQEKIPKSERHPEAIPEYCRGLAADEHGNVFIACTGNRCVMKIKRSGEASVVLRCQKPWTPTGVAVAGGKVYVLEYDDETPVEGRGWPPRVRMTTSEGKVETLVTITREGEGEKSATR